MRDGADARLRDERRPPDDGAALSPASLAATSSVVSAAWYAARGKCSLNNSSRAVLTVCTRTLPPCDDPRRPDRDLFPSQPSPGDRSEVQRSSAFVRLRKYVPARVVAKAYENAVSPRTARNGPTTALLRLRRGRRSPRGRPSVHEDVERPSAVRRADGARGCRRRRGNVL
ncbi:hypothetical protein PsYK624_171330 [Phanerochaete sordida]|uniref:Uncharacterized protein n=1 Tax=Phanerochaete sordida TaxID=48140 RepID=A0A9P3GTH5_9APHY|nr:hypothetical protein PsYK624_171330 [Phanerochaete sordida]